MPTASKNWRCSTSTTCWRGPVPCSAVRRATICGGGFRRISNCCWSTSFRTPIALQVELVEALCGERLDAGKLFFVGDYKQSIYRFRGADPDVFRDLRGRMPERGIVADEELSQPAGDSGFRQRAVLARPGLRTTSPCGRIARRPRRCRRSNSCGRPSRPACKKRTCGNCAAARPIGSPVACGACSTTESSLVGRTRYRAAGEPPTRAARPGDIAILFRALSDVELYEEALRRQGIDYYLVGGHAFYAQQEIFDLVNLLRAVASPSDEISLAGVLRSGFFSLSDETLFWLAQHDGAVRRIVRGSVPRADRARAASAGRICGGHDHKIARVQGPLENLRADRAGDLADRLRRRALARVLGQAQAGQPAKADRTGPVVRARGRFRPGRFHRPAVGVRGPAAEGSRWPRPWPKIPTSCG